MLEELRVRNFAIIEELELVCGEGFHVFTGETGAGKSILIDAIGLICGGRASPELIRTGYDEAVLEARFALPDADAAGRQCRALGIDPLEEPLLLIRRTIARSDRSRVTINGQMATVSQLTQLCTGLVHIHGQQDHHALRSPQEQMDLLDRYGSLQPQRHAYAALFARYWSLADERTRLDAAERDAAQRIELLEYQHAELDKAQLSEGEEELLAGEVSRLRHAAQLGAAAAESYDLLYGGDGSMIAQAARVRKLLETMAQHDPDMAASLTQLESAHIQLDDLARSMRGYDERVAHDPQRLAEVEDRMARLSHLRKKYGCETVAQLRERAVAVEGELGRLRHRGERRQAVEEEFERISAELKGAAGCLSDARRQAAEQFRRRIERELAQLKMAQATCVIQCVPQGPPHYADDGWDRVEFLVTANRGEEPKPLRKVASGGELSRLMLAVKSVLGGADRVPVLIFDEIDSGIGGAVAELVGRRLKSLSRGRQVLSITHLPQIAAFADRHYVVEKIAKKKRTITTLRELSRPQQVEELARMVGGRSITATTRRHAEDLLVAGQSAPE